VTSSASNIYKTAAGRRGDFGGPFRRVSLKSSHTLADSDPIGPAVPDLADAAVDSVAPADRSSG
jgi:hypothetical protein